MNQRYRGIILVLIATLLFSVLDTSSKFLTAHYAAAQIVWMRYLCQFILVLLIVVLVALVGLGGDLGWQFWGTTVLAAGPACNALLQGVVNQAGGALAAPRLPLQPVRGQLSWGLHRADGADGAGRGTAGLPPFPVNGHGGLVAHVPLDPQAKGSGEGLCAWHMGSTFERDRDRLPLTPAEQSAAHASNWQQLQHLLPGAASALQPAFASLEPARTVAVRSWASVRCTTPDRLPLVGPVHACALPGLWACTALGARGLSRAVLCGELLAAQLHGEPLPLDARLAQMFLPRPAH